jgi:hypothetical protein
MIKDMGYFEIDRDAMLTALSHTMGTGILDPKIWSCPCGCDAFVAYARNEKAVWLVANYTFEDADVIRVQGLSCVGAIPELPKVYSQTCPQDAMFIALWLTQGLTEALMEAFQTPIVKRELN